MAGSVFDCSLVILFVHQSKQIKYKSVLNAQVPRYLFTIKHNHYKNNMMDAKIQAQFWIDYCIMGAKYNGIILPLYVLIVINNKDIISAINWKSMDRIICIITLLNHRNNL